MNIAIPWENTIDTLLKRINVVKVGRYRWKSSVASHYITLHPSYPDYYQETGKLLHTLRECWRSFHFRKWTESNRRDAAGFNIMQYSEKRLKKAIQITESTPEAIGILTGAAVSPAAFHKMTQGKASHECPWCNSEWADHMHYYYCTKLPQICVQNWGGKPGDQLQARLGWPLENERIGDARQKINYMCAVRTFILVKRKEEYGQQDRINRRIRRNNKAKKEKEPVIRNPTWKTHNVVEDAHEDEYRKNNPPKTKGRRIGNVRDSKLNQDNPPIIGNKRKTRDNAKSRKQRKIEKIPSIEGRDRPDKRKESYEYRVSTETAPKKKSQNLRCNY